MGASDGLQRWKENTTAFDRVRSIVQGLTEPKTASWIAEEALVSVTTAGNHLDRLVELNVVQRVDGSTVRYRPDPIHVRLQSLRDLVDDHSQSDLVSLKQSLQMEIKEIHEEHGVQSTDGLIASVADTESAAETNSKRKALNELRTLEYRLTLVDEAISNYDEYDGPRSVPA